MHPSASDVPDTAFEALTGLPAPRASTAAEPMNVDSAGGVCDFGTTLLGDGCGPVTWAFPARQALRRISMGNSGLTIDFPIAAGLWYACERCRRCIKANAWAALASSLGFREGSAGSPEWQAFRAARLPGNGYAWPLVAHKLPDLHKHVRDAWGQGREAFEEPVRERLGRSRLLLEIDSHLYIRCGREGDDRWLLSEVGNALTAPLNALLNASVRLTLLPVLT